MKEIIYKCDICKETFKKDQLKTIKTLALSCTSDEDGKPIKEHIKKIEIELCDNCIKDSISLRVGYRGEELRIRKDGK